MKRLLVVLLIIILAGCDYPIDPTPTQLSPGWTTTPYVPTQPAP